MGRAIAEIAHLSGKSADARWLRDRLALSIFRDGDLAPGQLHLVAFCIADERELATFLRRRPKLDRRPPVLIDQPQDHGLGISLTGGMETDRGPDPALVIDDLERAAAEHGAIGIGPEPDTLRTDG